jgi:hypothetical protein
MINGEMIAGMLLVINPPPPTTTTHRDEILCLGGDPTYIHPYIRSHSNRV